MGCDGPSRPGPTSTRSAVAHIRLVLPKVSTMALVVRIGISVALLAAVARPSVGHAQQLASRTERQILEARAARAESAATSGSLADDTKTARLAEASVLRARLRDGDFHPGDRIQVTVVGESALNNTYPVRTGCVIEIPTLSAI